MRLFEVAKEIKGGRIWIKNQSVNSGPRHVISVSAELICGTYHFLQRIGAQISTSSLIRLEGLLLSPYADKYIASMS
jgi:hypothetical protein